jgi:hypothetical protein
VNLPGAGSATSTNAISFDFTTTNPLLSGAGLPSATTRAAGPTADLDEIGNVGVEGHVHRAGESGHDLAARNSGTSGATRMVDL